MAGAVEKYGARKAAIMVLDQILIRRYGMGYNDMPDTAERASVIDEMEQLLSDDVEKNKQQVFSLALDFSSEDNMLPDIFS